MVLAITTLSGASTRSAPQRFGKSAQKASPPKPLPKTRLLTTSIDDGATRLSITTPSPPQKAAMVFSTTALSTSMRRTPVPVAPLTRTPERMTTSEPEALTPLAQPRRSTPSRSRSFAVATQSWPWPSMVSASIPRSAVAWMAPVRWVALRPAPRKTSGLSTSSSLAVVSPRG